MMSHLLKVNVKSIGIDRDSIAGNVVGPVNIESTEVGFKFHEIDGQLICDQKQHRISSTKSWPAGS